jgi:hypothetical protein
VSWGCFAFGRLVFSNDFVGVLIALSALYEQARREEQAFTLFSSCLGSVSIGLIHATPGCMKSFKLSAERMAALILEMMHKAGKEKGLFQQEPPTGLAMSLNLR